MKSLIKKITNNSLMISLRNALNIKPVHMDIDNLHHISISDAFAWRTDNNFVTKFKYSDIFNLFYNFKSFRNLYNIICMITMKIQIFHFDQNYMNN